jgi:hypothetical protein
MQPFVLEDAPRIKSIEEFRMSFDLTQEQAERAYELQFVEVKIYKNDVYRVHVRRNKSAYTEIPDMVHLSIRRLDGGHLMDWREKQEIKNMLVGPECEGTELYPAESRLVDTSNQFHLWVFDSPTWRLGWGYNERLVRNESTETTVQRPR